MMTDWERRYLHLTSQRDALFAANLMAASRGETVDYAEYQRVSHEICNMEDNCPYPTPYILYI